MHGKRIIIAVACLIMLAFSMSAYGDTTPQPGPAKATAPVQVANPDISMEAELGYFGAITYMRDIPFTITLENKGPDIAGTIGVDLYRNNRYFDRYEYPISLASGAKKRVVLPVNLKMKQDHYVIEFTSGGSVVASVIKTPDRTIKPEASLVGVLSSDPQSLSYMNIDSLSRVWADRYEAWQLVTLDEDHFPQADSLMSTFSMVVVDGFDVSSLSAEQQKVLDRWVEGGGMVVVGGGAQAAAGYPYFAKYTGLKAGSLVEAADITPALIQYCALLGDKPLGQPVLLNEVNTKAAPLVADEHPLIFRHQSGSGFIYTTTFELGAKPLSGWSGMSAMWPRVLLKSANSQYAAMYSKISSKLYGGSYATYLLGNVPIENDSSTLPVIILLVIYLILAGLGSYLILKRLDKREWMWLTVPALAFVCMAGLYLMSQSLPFNKPAVASFTSIRMNPRGETSISSIADLSSPETGEALIQGESGMHLTPIDEYTYFYDDPMATSAPKQLLYRMVFGDTPAIGYPQSAPWTLRHVSLSGETPDFGELTGRLWMQEDGLHGQVVNNTPYTFKEGLLITNLGYARVGELKPGATGQVTLLRPKDEGGKSTSTASVSIYEAKIEEGVMISSNITRNSDMDLYPIIRAAIYPEEQAAKPNTIDLYRQLGRDELNLRSFRESAIHQVLGTNPTGSTSWVSPFHFVAFQEEIGQTKLYLNGQEVKKHGHQAVVDVLLTYEPVSPTGMVYYPSGTLSAYPVQQNADGSFSELDQKAADPYMSYQLTLQPVFCFTMPDTSKLTVNSMSILASSYDTVPTMQLYNHQTMMWEEQSTLFVTFTEKEIRPFIGPQGRMYVRFVPGTSSRDYDSVMVPSITLEGRVK